MSGLSSTMLAGFMGRVSASEPYDTWSGLERAADERFWDGLVLAVGDESRRSGAIYLLGNTAEILVKTAYYRVIGVPSNAGLGPYLKSAISAATWAGGNAHRLDSWLTLLVETRRTQGRPLSSSLAGTIRYHVLMIMSNWGETLRYRYTGATEAEVSDVFASVDWLRRQHELLWR